MTAECSDYEVKGYCLRGRECSRKHGDHIIKLDVSHYDGLVDAVFRARAKATAIFKKEQKELKKKQTDLLSDLVSRQRALVERLERSTDETEKLRLKTALNEMSQKTKDWIEQQEVAVRERQATQQQPSTSTGFQ